MKITRRQLRKLISESLEDEGLFDSMFSSGEWSSINQAIHLAEDMGMDIVMELPWDLVPDIGRYPLKNKEMNVQLADLVMKKVPHQEITSVFHRFTHLYRLAKKPEMGVRSALARREVGPMALIILKKLKSDQQTI